MLGEKYIEKKEGKIKLAEVVKAINTFDRATAACSYGNRINHQPNVYELLPKEEKKIIAELTTQLAKEWLIRSRKQLEDLGSGRVDYGIEVPDKPRPEDYRLEYRHLYGGGDVGR